MSFLFAACGEQKKFHEMRDATVAMKDTTEEMNEKTKTLADSTQRLDEKTGKVVDVTTQMKERTDKLVEMTEELGATSRNLSEMNDELYDALRQGNALQLRREAYDAVLKAPTMFKKIAEAGKYFMSFEVQLWNQMGQDFSVAKRDQLSQQAAQEFFLEIEGLAPRDGSVDPTAAPDIQNLNSKENRQASFNAFAVTMHHMNRKQGPIVAKRNMDPVSMLSLMEEALLSKKRGAGEDLGTKAPFVREVLAHEPKALQLLQTRYNMFPAIFVDFVSQIDDKNLLQKAWMTYMGWELDLDRLNANQLEYLQTEVLQQALHSRALLQKIGVKPRMDKNIARLIRNMKIKASHKQTADIAARQTELIGMIRELQKNL